MSRLVPDPSGAMFFAKGWEVELAQWLKTLSAGVHIGSFLLVDPYFDEAPLIHAFARASTEDAEYAVLTEFNHRARHGTLARKNLVTNCEAMRAMLPRRFSILEIRPAGSSTAQLIHDRIIIVRSRNGDVASAFSLTNSLQGATRQHPMLATPIPADVLPSVLQYVDQIRLGNPFGTVSARVDKVWQNDRSARPRSVKARSAPFPLIADFLLRKRCLLRYRTNEAAKLALQRAGIYDSSADHFNAGAIRCQLTKIAKKVPRRALSKAWSAVSEVSVRMEDQAGLDALDQLIQPMGDSGFDLPESIVKEAVYHVAPRGIADAGWTSEDLSVARQTLVSLPEALYFAENLLEGPHEFLGGTPWPIVQAVRFLIRKRPERIVRAFEVLVEGYRKTLEGDSATPASGPWARAISIAIRHIAASVRWQCEADVRLLMRSSVPLLRALGAETCSDGFRRARTLESPSSVYLDLPQLERVLVIAQTTRLLRADRARLSKRLGKGDDVKLLDSKLPLLRSLLLENWPLSPTAEELRAIAHAFSGPLEGSDAPELFRIFKEGKIRTGFDIQLAIQLLLTLLLEKLQQFASAQISRSFYLPVDGPLTLVCSEALCDLDPHARAKHFAKLEKVGNAFLDRLRTPFFRSREYWLWASAKDGGTWLLVYLDVIDSAQRSRGEGLPAALEAFRSELLSALQLLPDESRIQQPLDWFRNFVAQTRDSYSVIDLADYLVAQEY